MTVPRAVAFQRDAIIAIVADCTKSNFFGRLRVRPTRLFDGRSYLLRAMSSVMRELRYRVDSAAGASCPNGLGRRAASADQIIWLKIKNPDAPAVPAGWEEDWNG